jgi:hypothetical protein
MSSWRQAVAVTPDISCEPGWCLNYTQRAFNVGWAGSTATDAWNKAQFKHTGTDFPSEVAVPVWFAMAGEPAGHVVVRMGDGTIYSTSHPTNKTPYHHPSLKHLMDYYGGRLTLRGWSEDIGGTRVIEEGGKNMDYDDVVAFYRFGLGREPESEQVVRNLVGKKPAEAMDATRAGKEWRDRQAAVKNLATVQTIAGIRGDQLIRIAKAAKTTDSDIDTIIKKLEAPAGEDITDLEPGVYRVSK